MDTYKGLFARKALLALQIIAANKNIIFNKI